MPVLVVTSRDNVQTHVLEEGKPLFLGRSDGCDIVLPSSAVSRRHAVVLYKNGVCGVKDLGSFNGTSLNGEVIQESRHLTDADVLRISSYIIRLHSKDHTLAVEEGTGRTGGFDESAAPGVGVPSTPRAVQVDSHRFENSSLPLPRAMQKQREMSRRMKKFQTSEPRSRDTRTFSPGRETVRFIKANRQAESEPPETGTDSGYFTPFPVSESTVDDAVPNLFSPAEEIVPVTDLAEFEESPLAPLESISQFDEGAGPTPFLASVGSLADLVLPSPSGAEAIIPLKSDDGALTASLSSEAEAIIPLLDDTPFVATLSGDAADGELEQEIADEEQQAHKTAQPSHDTAMYTLPAGGDETDGNDSDTGEFQQVLSAPLDEDSAADEDRSGTAILERVIEGSRSTRRMTKESGRLAGGESAGASSSSTSVRRRKTTRVGIKGKSSLLGISSIPISASLMVAINARLALYSKLNELREERKRFRRLHPELSEEVEEELNRQDAEEDDLPTTEDAERQLQYLRERKEQLNDAIRQARNAGLQGPPAPTPEMQFAEDLAVKQWRLVGESNRKALPPIYREAYALAANEPLAQEFKAAGINHGRLFGGAMYLLALESLATMANQKRFRIANTLSDIFGPEEEGDGIRGKLEEIGKKAGNLAKLTQIRKQRERLKDEDRVNAIRVELASREAVFIEKTMARVFHQVYKKAALHFIPRFESMPASVRAFLRHGVVGFSPWWMTKEVREFILRDCSENIIAERSTSLGMTNVLYADEYLFAVSQMECTPSPDEEVQGSSPTSVEWRTDRAYRRIVNARTYNVLMEEMLSLQDVTGTYLGEEVKSLESRMEGIKKRAFTRDREELFDLQIKLQQLMARHRNSRNNMKRIHDELIPSILDAMEDAERHFRTGALRIPDQETLINREVDALFRVSRRLEGAKERFVPMAVREHYRAKAEKVNDRKTVRSTLARMEELDPGIFVRTIIPSKSRRMRVDLRMGPTVLIFPAAGKHCLCSMGREGMESGHLVMPTCFVRTHLRSRQMTYMFADFRWETSRAMSGRNVYTADTLVGVMARTRRAAKEQPESVNEKRLIFMNMSGKENWRRVYELYLPNALNAGRALFQYNSTLYEELIGKHIDPLEGVKVLRRAWADPNAKE